MKKEIDWINTAKVIGMILVFLLHTRTRYHFDPAEFFTSYYMPFYVNVFFFISGYLIFRKQCNMRFESFDSLTWYNIKGGGRDMLKNIIFRIYIPSIIFIALQFFPKILLRNSQDVGSLFLLDVVFGRSAWFTSALAVSELLLVVIFMLYRSSRFTNYIICSILFFVIAEWINSCGYGIYIHGDNSAPFMYKSGMVATLFLVLGGLYWKYEEKIDNFFSGWKNMFLVLALLLYVYTIVNGKYFVNAQMANIDMEGVILIIVSVYLFIRICKLLKPSRFTTYFGRQTLALYLLSGLPEIFAIITNRFFHNQSWLLFFLVFIVSTTTGFVITYLIDKYFPFMMDIRVIKRKNNRICTK